AHICEYYMQEGTFTGNLLSSYIHDRINVSRGTAQSRALMVWEVMQSKAKDEIACMAALCSLGNAQDALYREALVYCMSLHIRGEKAPYFVQSVSNILGTFMLSDQAVQNSVLSIPIFARAFTGLYPHIEISDERYRRIFKAPDMITHMHAYTGYPEFYSLLTEYIYAYKEESKENLSKCKNIFKDICIKTLFLAIFRENTVDHADALREMLSKEGAAGKEIARMLDLIWFGLACIKKKDYFSLVKSLYDRIPMEVPHSMPSTFFNCFHATALGVVLYMGKNAQELAEDENTQKFSDIKKTFADICCIEW
ncbi:uncharacterized protein NEMAJ01_2116, partial [Nematocida major]|uniref:uncharacterized protein n=1 Tax=Nematocida major TaxID=1912982 RepID=UPI002008B3D4